MDSHFFEVDQLPHTLRRRIDVDPVSSCWNWTGAMRHSGYGAMFLTGTKSVAAHRYVYEYTVGPIPDGLVLDHLCRNRRCVNPVHLEAVTQRINSLRGDTIPRRQALQTHCVNGHEFTTETIYVHPQRGTRLCKVCMSDAGARRRREGRGPCQTDDCERLAHSRGMCQSCYMVWWRKKAA